MRSLLKRTLASFFAAMLLCILPATALADDIDSTTFTIDVVSGDERAPIENCTVTIYQVTQVSDNQVYSFTEAFKGFETYTADSSSGKTGKQLLNDIAVEKEKGNDSTELSQALASALVNYITSENTEKEVIKPVSGEEASVGTGNNSYKVYRATNLQPGNYLVVIAPPTGITCSPSLVDLNEENPVLKNNVLEIKPKFGKTYNIDTWKYALKAGETSINNSDGHPDRDFGNGLPGAEFVLYRHQVDTEGSPVMENGKSVREYYCFKDNQVTWTEKLSDATIRTTVSKNTNNGIEYDGQLEKPFKYLEPGVYYLEEIKAPSGYNKVSVDSEEEMKIDLSSVEYEDNYTAEKWVQNNAGIVLPGTGGVGTIIFYCVGGALVLGALVVLIARRRMASRDK